RPSYCSQRRLGRSIPVGQPALPVFDKILPVVPLVRPCKDNDPTATLPEDCAYLPVQGLCLFLLTITEAVQSDLAEKNRPILAQTVQPGDIILESLFRFKVDVEAQKV